MYIVDHDAACPTNLRGAVIALGNFDGVHKGHQAICACAQKIAQAQSVPWGVLTFNPHPMQLFSPDAPPALLTSLEQKYHYIEALGANICVSLRFDQPFSEMSAETFVTEILIKRLEVAHLVIGYDFIFGHRRLGNALLLQKFVDQGCFKMTQLKAVGEGDAIYSSTAVRQALKAGNVGEAERILGRPFAISARVARGQQLGRKLGFPTANLKLGSYIRPRYGVYAVQVTWDNQQLWGVANLGVRPSVDGEHEWLEVHIFDFSGTLYDQIITVEFIDFIRPEQSFENIEKLRIQIDKDCQIARQRLMI